MVRLLNSFIMQSHRINVFPPRNLFIQLFKSVAPGRDAGGTF